MMGRDLSSMARHFQKNPGAKGLSKGAGRPRSLTKNQVDRIADTTARAVTAANSEYQVTDGMVRRALKLQVFRQTCPQCPSQP